MGSCMSSPEGSHSSQGDGGHSSYSNKPSNNNSNGYSNNGKSSNANGKTPENKLNGNAINGLSNNNNDNSNNNDDMSMNIGAGGGRGGLAMTENKKAQRERSYLIDKQIEEDSKRYRKECKILLLGESESFFLMVISLFSSFLLVQKFGEINEAEPSEFGSLIRLEGDIERW